MTTSTITTHDFDNAEESSKAALPAGAFRASVRAGRYPVVPDRLTGALSAREAVHDMHARVFEGSATQQDLPTAILEAFTAGTSPQTALDAALDAHYDRERRTVVAGVLERAMDGAEAFVRQAVTDALPELLGGLRGQLNGTIVTLRAAYTDAGALDVNAPDPLLVAQATKRQQSALVTIAESTREYRRIRTAQREALAASALPVPGYHNFRASWGWRDVFATGVHEVSAPSPWHGLPGKGLAPRLAVREVVTRSDVWLPDPDELTDAYDRAQAQLDGTPQKDEDPFFDNHPDAQHGELNPASVAYLDAVTSNNTHNNRGNR